MEVQIINHIGECKELFEEFSPQKTLYDKWDFRLAFWENFKFKPHFVLLSDQSQNVALLPLWFNHEQHKYFWFGDIGDDFHWQEDNNFWIKDKKYLHALIENCPRPVLLNNFSEDSYKEFFHLVNFKKANPKQILDIGMFSSPEDYLTGLNKKVRSSLRNARNKVLALNPQLEIDDFSEFDTLLAFNKTRFSDSPFHDHRLIKTFKDLIKSGHDNMHFRVRMISIKVFGETVGVDFIFIVGDIYYPILCGNNLEKCPGIGNYLNLLDIEDAINLGMRRIDFTESDENSYKEKLFKTLPQYSLEI